jgi:hypothetical protein
MAIHPTTIFGLNNAYGHIVRRGGARKVYAQRFLLPDALKYKKRWLSLFKYEDIPPGYFSRLFLKCLRGEALSAKRCVDLEERDKPFLILKFLFLYEEDFFAYETGRLRGYDVSNFFKLIEDTFCEYIGIDDSRTLAIIGEKMPSRDFTTQIVLSVYAATAYAFLDDRKDLLDRYGELLFRRSAAMSRQKSTLPAMRAYSDLDDLKKEQVNALLEAYIIEGQGTYQFIKKALEDFGSDPIMILTVVGAYTKRGYLNEGLWSDLVAVMRVDEVAEGTVVKEPTRLKRREIPEFRKGSARGKLPFRRRFKSTETRAHFLENFKRTEENFSRDSMNWDTGQINFEAPVLFGLAAKTPERLIYEALVTGKRTYSYLCSLLGHTKKLLPKNRVDRYLKNVMIEPSACPPWMGTYHEDPETGEMWIVRDSLVALAAAKQAIGEEFPKTH